MSANRSELALRKEMLIAQSSLYRAQLRYEVMALRARATRGSSWVGAAISVISIARTVLSIASLFRK